MKLLLDTKEFLLYVTDESRLSEPVKHALRCRDNEVFVSVVTCWELAVKQGIGKLSLPEDAARFVPRERSRHLFSPLPLDESDVSVLSRLPSVHRDPFDRMLICQAISRGLTLVTSDSLVLQYPVSVL